MRFSFLIFFQKIKKRWFDIHFGGSRHQSVAWFSAALAAIAANAAQLSFFLHN